MSNDRIRAMVYEAVPFGWESRETNTEIALRAGVLWPTASKYLHDLRCDELVSVAKEAGEPKLRYWREIDEAASQPTAEAASQARGRNGAGRYPSVVMRVLGGSRREGDP